MCGIAGYIGKSKNPKASYELLTHLFVHLESRGGDAAGCWGTEVGENGSIYYHKEPGKSSAFVDTKFWKNLQKVDTNLMLIHARGASTGMGVPRVNKNNHPFVTEDKRIGLVHNGVIYESKYLKNAYETKSDCDSEVLLRIFEAGLLRSMTNDKELVEGNYLHARLAGIKDIWSNIHEGHMAVAIGETGLGGERNLYLFRNDKRPIWLADLRSCLGQIFFFSATEIWDKAARAMKNNVLPTSKKLTQLKEQEAWCFSIDLEDEIVTNDNYRRFIISAKRSSKVWTEGEVQKVGKPLVNMKVITDLTADEEVYEEPKVATKTTQGYGYGCNYGHQYSNGGYVQPATTTTVTKPVGIEEPRFPKSAGYNKGGETKKTVKLENEDLFSQKTDEQGSMYACDMDILDVENAGANISKHVSNIVTQVSNMAMEGSLTMAKYQEILDYLEQCDLELQGTEKLLNA